MKEVLKNGKFRLILEEEGAALYKRYGRKPVEFIPWREAAETGFYLDKAQKKIAHYDLSARPFPSVDDSSLVTGYDLYFYVSRVAPAARTGEALAGALKQSGLVFYVSGGQGVGAYGSMIRQRDAITAKLRVFVKNKIRFIEKKN